MEVKLENQVKTKNEVAIREQGNLPIQRIDPNRATLSVFLTPEIWHTVKEQCEVVLKSGFLPATINTPEKAIAIALKGMEIGIPIMQSLSHIHIVKGTPGMSAELMRAMVFKHIPLAILDVIESSNEKATIRAKRPGGRAVDFTFTIEDAKKAKVFSTNPDSSWQKYPKAMLLARATSAACRQIFPDALAGISYTPEELGAEVSEDGQVITAQYETISNTPDSDATAPEQPTDEKGKLIAAVLKREQYLAKNKINGFENEQRMMNARVAYANSQILDEAEISDLDVYSKELQQIYEKHKKESANGGTAVSGDRKKDELIENILKLEEKLKIEGIGDWAEPGYNLIIRKKHFELDANLAKAATEFLQNYHKYLTEEYLKKEATK